jgi:twitching motility protein PilT
MMEENNNMSINDNFIDNSNMFIVPDENLSNDKVEGIKNTEIDIQAKTGTIIKSVDSGASITADMILKYLLQEGVIVDSDLIGLLGEERHHLTIPGLERALYRESRISDTSLAKLKGMLSGKDYIKSNETKTKYLFDKIVSKNLGAVGLEGDSMRIAMIEDTPAHIEKISEILGTKEFEVVFCTITQLKELYNSCYESTSSKDKTKTVDILEILDECIRTRGSDVHISVGLPPVIRIDGKLTMMDRQILDAEWMRVQVYNLVGPDIFAEIEKKHDHDMALPYGTARFRLNIGKDNRGFTIVARKLPTKIPTPIDLNLPEAIVKFTELDRGLVLVTGPTGSGKSTTLASLLAEISIKHQKHIITLEDPIEFTLPRGKSVVNQRQLHASFTGFGNALRQALRQDPDVILVGEMRDLETIRTAVQAAETGHLVFGTLHTYDAASTVARIVSSFPAEEQDQVRAQLSSIVKGIVSQTLLPHRSGTGRVAAYEILVSTPAISNNLRKVDGHLSLRQSIEMGKSDGMQTMDIALANLVHRGLVTEESAREKCVDLENFKKLSKGS